MLIPSRAPHPFPHHAAARRAHDATGVLVQTGPVRIRPFGTQALLVEVDRPFAARSLAAWVRGSGVAVDEVVPAARTVLLDGVADRSRLDEVLAAWIPGDPGADGDLVEVPVSYDGPDLAFVARVWGVDPDRVPEIHAGIDYVAEFCGFAPGFSYLSGLPEARAVPRLTSPRPRVPAGAVALAGTWCGIYPSSSPGGWQILGTTDAPLWDVDRVEPALLPPGTRVRFVAA